MFAETRSDRAPPDLAQSAGDLLAVDHEEVPVHSRAPGPAPAAQSRSHAFAVPLLGRVRACQPAQCALVALVNSRCGCDQPAELSHSSSSEVPATGLSGWSRS